VIVLYAYNEALMREPMGTPLWKDWPTLMERANIQAENHAGYLGRYRGEDDPLGYIAPRFPQEELIMGNLSAWTNKRDLYDYTFGAGTHGGLVKHRSRWFEPWPFERPHFVMWWGKARLTAGGGITPVFDLDTAMLMQAQLQIHGPDANCFGWGRQK